MSDIKYKIKSVRVGFGATMIPKEVGGTVKKYYFEPEIELQVPAECDSEEDLQSTLDNLASDVLDMVQSSVRKKALADKKAQTDGQTGQ